MLAALITILILGGGSSVGWLYDFGDMKKLVKTHVADDKRKDAALDIIKAFKQRSKEENKNLETIKKQLDSATVGPDAPENRLASLGDDFVASNRIYYRDLLDLRFELKDQFTREEWAAAYSDDQD